MTFVVSKKAAISVKEMYLSGPGISKIPLKSMTINMGIDIPCTCTCTPIIGRDRLNGKSSDPKFIEKLDQTKKYTANLNIRNIGSIGGNQTRLFVGRVMSTGMGMSTDPFGSNIEENIVLHHVAQSDLSGVSIGQRSYFQQLDHIVDFRINPNSNTCYGNAMFTNTHLKKKFIALYLKDLCTGLVNWYMNNGGGKMDIDIPSILKAVPCYVKQSISGVVTRSNGNSVDSVSGAFGRAVRAAFEGAAAQKANLLSILSTLASFGMLTLVPTSDALVITPKLDVARWSSSTGASISRGDVTSINCPTTLSRLPIEVVCLNKRLGAAYFNSDGANQTIHGVTSWGSNFRYPEKLTNAGVLIVDPPAIISGILDGAANIATVSTPGRPIGEGGYGMTRNNAGAEPVIMSKDAPKLLGKAAAQLMWQKLAFAHRAASISLLPHWVFDESFDSEVHAAFETGVPWSLLGKELKFRLPYNTNKESSKDVTYIGYVKGLTLTADVEQPSLSVVASLTNVRTEKEDELFAPYNSANPLYDNIDAKPN